jgi:quaternary ammonium compound-resistance protein SugE
MLAWTCLAVAGLLEVVWVIGLKRSEGFTKVLPTLVTVLGLTGSMGLLGVSMRTIPMATAYAVWVGIGVVGTALVGIFWFRESWSAAQALCLVLLVIAIAGLKILSRT